MPANTFTSQRILSAQELTRMGEAMARAYVFPGSAGGAVTTNNDMAPSVAAIERGLVIVNGTLDTAGYAGGTVTVTTAHASLPRRDLIYYEPGVGCGVTAGTAAAKPALPSLAAGRIAIYEVYVAANDTIIGSDNLIDRRQSVLVSPYDAIRDYFRATTPRRVLAEWSASPLPLTDTNTQYAVSGMGVGFSTVGAAAPTLTALLLELYAACLSGNTGNAMLGSTTTNGVGSPTLITATAPNKNPRMLVRWIPGTSNANLTTTMAGFFASISATANGAYLRANTTGNLEFVTRQGTETTTGLGARPTALTSYEIWTPDAGVTWLCRNNTTGAVVATHTGTPPTATTALGFGLVGISASSSLNVFNPAYLFVDANYVV